MKLRRKALLTASIPTHYSLEGKKRISYKVQRRFRYLKIARSQLNDLSMEFSIFSLWFTTCHFMNEKCLCVKKKWNMEYLKRKNINAIWWECLNQYRRWKCDAKTLNASNRLMYKYVALASWHFALICSHQTQATCHRNHMNMWHTTFVNVKRINLW